jgi:hypothetical protein
MNKIYRISPRITQSIPATTPDGKPIDGHIGVQLLFYSRETAQKFIDEYCNPSAWVEETYVSSSAAPTAPSFGE